MAGAGDIALLARWRGEFAAAALPAGTPRPDDPRAVVMRHLVAGQGNVLWEVGGEPVSLAVASAPEAGMSRIGPVWTPPEHRGRGFGPVHDVVDLTFNRP
jgi:predicted GNAT family acetyltransferase